MKQRLARLAGGGRPRPRDVPSGALTATARGALEQAGCPICQLVHERSLHSLEAVLWEQVTDPATHRRLLAARGFCFEHAWALIPASERVYSHHGIATILRRILEDLLRTLDRRGPRAARRWLRPEAGCSVCALARAVTSTFSREVARLYATDPALIGGRPALLCRPHLAAVATFLPPLLRHDIAEEVADRQHVLVERLSPADCLPILVGRRPAYLPNTVEYCPACARVQRERRGHLSPTMDRLDAWTAFVDDPGAVASMLETRGAEWLANGHAAEVFPPPGKDRLAFDGGDSAGLCLGHLRVALAAREADGVMQEATVGIATLIRHLRRFEESADYRFRGALSADERVSWRAAIARVAGEIPGIDLHASAAPRRDLERPWSTWMDEGRKRGGDAVPADPQRLPGVVRSRETDDV